MLFPGVDFCFICYKKVIELFKRARKNEFYHFLFLCVYYLRVEKVHFHVGFIQAFAVRHLLSGFAFLFIATVQHIWREFFFFPEGVDYFEGVAIFEACKYELLFFFFDVFELFAGDADGVTLNLCYFCDGIDDDGGFLDDSKHVGNEHEMFLSDVETAEEGKAYFEGALVVLKDGLIGES